MRKNLFSMLMAVILGVSGNVWAAGGPVAIDLNCTEPAGCVQTNEISDGAVTNSKIADGSVTNAKIGETISASKIEKPANVVIVAKSGGDYTTVNAALAAINPTASSPYVIKVMPGTYEENDVVRIKSYVHLQGAGRDVTTALSHFYSVIDCSGVTNVTISGLTITTTFPLFSSDIWGITIGSSTFITIDNNHFTSIPHGIGDFGSTATTVIRGNIFSNINLYGQGIGIEVGDWSYPFRPSSPVITGNLFKGNITAIRASNGSPFISNNVFTENGRGITAGAGTFKDNMFTGNNVGLAIDGGGSPLILSNKSTGNDCDIRIYGSLPIMNYNVFDTLCGISGPAGSYIGKYNLKSDGTDAPTADTFQ